MTTEAPKGLGAALGALIAIALASIALVLSGGEHVGKKTIHGDNDLPPIAQGRQYLTLCICDGSMHRGRFALRGSRRRAASQPGWVGNGRR